MLHQLIIKIYHVNECNWKKKKKMKQMSIVYRNYIPTLIGEFQEDA